MLEGGSQVVEQAIEATKDGLDVIEQAVDVAQ
jgi:hypothetical protein